MTTTPTYEEQVEAIVHELRALDARFQAEAAEGEAALAAGSIDLARAKAKSLEAILRHIDFYDRAFHMIEAAAKNAFNAEATRLFQDAAGAVGGLVLQADEAEARNQPALAAAYRSIEQSLRRIPEYIETNLVT